jgi:4-hydroxybenzoate polyprenyltransferase
MIAGCDLRDLPASMPPRGTPSNVREASMNPPPLVVDLEQRLLRSNLAVEGFLRLFKRHPLRAIRLCGGLAVRGRTPGSQLREILPCDAGLLAYDPDVIRRIQHERSGGRTIMLFSQNPDVDAQGIADHLQLFDRVILGDPRDRGASHALLAAEYGQQGVEYLDELPIKRWPEAWSVWRKALRLHQWTKNLLVFVPLLASHRLRDGGLVWDEALAFLLFSLCASSVYLVNDLLDIEDDRQHRTKRLRPIAAGQVGSRAALGAAPVLLLCAALGATLLLPPSFAATLAAYYGLTLAYSTALKRIMMLDVVVLAILYTLRIVAGAYAIGGELTFWMIAFSMFIFTSLALAKRYAELHVARSTSTGARVRGRGYAAEDLPMIAALGAASGYISVMVLALYIQDQRTTALYRHPKLIWLACPLLLFWIGRTWMLTHRGDMSEDPVVFAITDRPSLLVAALFAVIFAAAA